MSFFFQAEDGIRDRTVTGVQTCALPISGPNLGGQNSAAIYTTEFCPPRFGPVLASVIDLLAAVPSVVYGLWGFFVLIPKIGRASCRDRACTVCSCFDRL